MEIRDQKWFGRFETLREVQVRAGIVAGKPNVLPGIYQRGMDARNPEIADALRQTRVDQAQYVAPANELPPPASRRRPRGRAAGDPAAGQGTRRIRVFARGDVPMHGQWQQDPQTNQAVAVIDQGVTMVIEGLTARKGNVPGMGGGPLTIDLSTDRLVIWTVAQQQPDINAPLAQDENQPLEIYMEGNVVFRQGDRIIYADRMYYDVRNHVGTVLAADMLTPAPGYEGKVRVHANVLQQTGEDHFRAQDAFVTSSRLGIPRYRMQMGEATFDNVQTPRVDCQGNPVIDPKTGQPAVNHQELVAAQNNLLYIEDVPIFYWPTFATDLNDPSFYLRRVQVSDNGVFGTSSYRLGRLPVAGHQRSPRGHRLDPEPQLHDLRGFSEGTEFLYNRDDFFGIPGQTSGKFDFWGISDRGTDNLGRAGPASCPSPTSTIAIGSSTSIARTWARASPSPPSWARSAIATSCRSISSRTGTS